jgi:hypothetical protein
MLVLLLSGAAAAQQPQLKVPDKFKITILIKTAVIALNQANLTGNYSVLRDLTAPGFAQANSQARLAKIFQNLRDRKIDLGPTVLFEPVLTREPFIGKNGLLLMDGYFATKPEQVNFEFAFQMVGGDWRLFGLRVDTTRNEPVGATGAAQPTLSPAPVGQTERNKNSASD